MDRNIKFPLQIRLSEQNYNRFVKILEYTETKRYSQILPEQQRNKISSSLLLINDIFQLAQDYADKASTFKQSKKQIQRIEEIMKKAFKYQNMKTSQVYKHLTQLVQIYHRYHRLINLLTEMPILDLSSTKEKVDAVFKDQRQKKIGQVIVDYKNYEIQLYKLQKIRNKLQDQAEANDSLINILKDIEQFGVTNGIPFKFEPTKSQRLNKQLASFVNYLSEFMIQFDKNNFATDYMQLLLNKQKSFEQKEKKLMQFSRLKKAFLSPCFQLFKQHRSYFSKLKNLIPKTSNKKDDESQSQYSVNKPININNQELLIKRLNSQLLEYSQKDKIFSNILAENQDLKLKLKNTRSSILDRDNSNKTYKKCLMNASCILQDDEYSTQKNEQIQYQKYLTLLKQKQILQKKISLSKSNERQILRNLIQMQINLRREAQINTKLLKQYDHIVQQNTNLRNNNISIKQQYQTLAQRFKSISSLNKLDSHIEEIKIEPVIPKIKQAKAIAKSTIFVSSDDSSDDIQYFGYQQEKGK